MSAPTARSQQQGTTEQPWVPLNDEARRPRQVVCLPNPARRWTGSASQAARSAGLPWALQSKAQEDDQISLCIHGNTQTGCASNERAADRPEGMCRDGRSWR